MLLFTWAAVVDGLFFSVDEGNCVLWDYSASWRVAPLGL